jgi:choline-sulfatase
LSRPNILWICTDQQRFDTLGCYGNEYVQTPNIDKLAASGTLFENAFCNSTVCAPSRASFLTGRYPSTTRCRKNGQNIPEDEVLVTKLLHDAGYTCGLAGKLHLSACFPKVCHGTERRIDDGFDVFHWSHHPQEDWPTNAYSHWLRAKGKKYESRPVEGTRHVVLGPDAEDHQATWCSEMAIQFIEAHEHRQQPWLFSVNIFAPHHPFDPPAAQFNRYLDKLDDIPLPSYFDGEPDSKTSFQRRDHVGAYGNPRMYPFNKMSEREHKLIRAAYWAMVDLIDEQVGRMVAALERTGQLDNTIIVFMSDHGELLGDHGVYLKGPHFYEPSVHVPLIVSYPGRVKAGARSSELVELLDLAPTFLEAAGLPIYRGMQGKSLWPVLEGQPVTHRADVFCEAYETPDNDPGFAAMVRTQDSKLVFYHTPGDGEMYDLAADPEERHNLYNSADHSGMKLQLMERLLRRMGEKADPMPPRISPW